jgi:hypothetical protein
MAHSSKVRVLVAAALLALHCGGESPGTVGSQAVCEANCDRAQEAGCERTPPGYVESCKKLCASSRSKFPSCTDQIDAVSACVADKVTFLCQEGLALPRPVGACGPEGQACLACTKDLLGCGN